MRLIRPPGKVSIIDFSYALPNERIAKYPLEERDESKLLIYQQGKILENKFKHLSSYIPADAMIIFNDTKVIKARLQFQKPTGSRIEIFCLEPLEPSADLTSSMQLKERIGWKCLIKGLSKWKKGEYLEKTMRSTNGELILRADYIQKKADYFIIEFSWVPRDMPFMEVLSLAGSIPLPPYLNREASEIDSSRYQTIYASLEGSVAAPTAGLHFTDHMFEKLAEKKIKSEFITLHVGAGTFKPVLSELIEQHEMHDEYIQLSASTLKSIAAHFPMPVIPIGTTSLRTIESLYWLGVKVILQPDISRELLIIGQWEAYELEDTAISVKESLNAVLKWMERHHLERLVTKTRLLIVPGYEFKIAKALVSNFHQPRSTLLMLVAALIGKDWKFVYDYAMDHDFRFLSYGDGCLLFGKQ